MNQVPLAVLPGGHSVQQGWDSRREVTRVRTTSHMEKYFLTDLKLNFIRI
jgi:hypothetical protein